MATNPLALAQFLQGQAQQQGQSNNPEQPQSLQDMVQSGVADETAPSQKLFIGKPKTEDAPESMSDSLLRSFVQPQAQQIPAFKDDTSPARSLLSNMFLGMSAGLTGQKFQTIQQQKYQRYLDQVKVQLEQQQRNNQLQIGQMKAVQQYLKQQDMNQFHTQLNALREEKNADTRNYQTGQLQARLGMNDIQFQRFLSQDAQYKAIQQHLKNQDANAANPVSKDPEYIRALGLVNAQYQARQQDPNDPNVYPKFLQDVNDQAEAFKAQQAALNPRASEFYQGQSDKSYQFHVQQLDALAKPISELSTRFSRLQDTVAQGTPQADAFVAPELLSIMAGGAGSGLRMNEAEIYRAVNGRSNWEKLKADINQWAQDPAKANSITAAQRAQIHSLMNAVQARLTAKQNALNKGYQDLAGTTDVSQHRAIFNRTRQSLVDADAAPQNSSVVDDLVKKYGGK